MSFAGACEGGCLKPGGHDCSPEAYIRRIRRLIEADLAPCRGAWYPDVRVAEDHPLVAYARQLGLATEREQRYGQWRVRVDLTREQRDLVFDFIDRFPDLMAWQLARVCGLPST